MSTILTKFTRSALLAGLVLGVSACSGESDRTADTGSKEVAAAVKQSSEASAPATAAETVAAAQSVGADQEIVSIYQRSCISCHLSGAAGAPKSHDTAAWAPKLEKGMPALVASINNGLNAMPPKGMCFDCSDAQYKELINYMAGPKPE